MAQRHLLGRRQPHEDQVAVIRRDDRWVLVVGSAGLEADALGGLRPSARPGDEVRAGAHAPGLGYGEDGDASGRRVGKPARQG